MIRILVINPNTSEAMTGTILLSAKNAAGKETIVDAVTNAVGPTSVEGVYDEIITSHGVLEILLKEKDNYDAFIIACFSDHPVIQAGREAIAKPVIGIFEAACMVACLIGARFSIVTTSPRWVPLLEDAVCRIGLKDRFSEVLSSGLSVNELEAKGTDEIKAALLSGAKAAVASGADVICLGCAGMAGLSEELERHLHIPVVDPVAAAVKMAEGLAALNLKTGKIGAYGNVDSRKVKGMSDSILATIYEA